MTKYEQKYTRNLIILRIFENELETMAVNRDNYSKLYCVRHKIGNINYLWETG